MSALWRWVNRVEVAQLRVLGVSGIAVLRRRDLLVLETIGRRSGRIRRTPLAHWRDGDDLLIAGGAGGRGRVDWIANLRAHPPAHVVVRRRRLTVTARELAGSERDRARAEALRRWPEVAGYERASGRPLPVFALQPDNG